MRSRARRRAGLQRCGDGGQGGEIACQQVPVGGAVRGVRAAGPLEDDPIAGTRIASPGSGEALVPVDHEVECESAGLHIHMAHGVGAGDGDVVCGEGLAQLREVVRGLQPQLRLREDDLHVGVGAGRLRERREAGAADDEPHEGGREPRALEDLHDVLGALRTWAVAHGREMRPFERGCAPTLADAGEGDLSSADRSYAALSSAHRASTGCRLPTHGQGCGHG